MTVDGLEFLVSAVKWRGCNSIGRRLICRAAIVRFDGQCLVLIKELEKRDGGVLLINQLLVSQLYINIY